MPYDPITKIPELHHNPMSQIRGILAKKIHTSRNRRFHVYILQTPKRQIQAIYFGFAQPIPDRDKEVLLTGKWQQHSEYGPQFYITKFEEALPYIARTKGHINRIFKALAS